MATKTSKRVQARMNYEVFDPNEAAEILKMSRSSVVRLLKQGKLTGVKAGNLWRIPSVNIDKFLGLA